MSQPFLRTTRALRTDAPHTAWWAWALALPALAAWGLWFAFAGVGVVARSTSARLEVAQHAAPLAAPQGAVLVRHRLALGQAVQAGDVLVELDDRAARLRLAEAEARSAAVAPRVAALQSALQALADAQAAARREAAATQDVARARLQEAGAAADFAAEQARRLQAEARAGGAAEIDALRAAADARRLQSQQAALAADLRRLALEADTRDREQRARAEALRRDLSALEAERGAAAAAQASAAAEAGRLQLRAPVSGVLADVKPLAAGAWVAEGQVLASVLPPGELLIVAEFEPAAALGRVQPGQPATLRLDGFPWAQYGAVQARVQRVAGEVRDRTLRVELRPEGGSRAPLAHGLPGLVEVRLEEATPAQLLWRVAGAWR